MKAKLLKLLQYLIDNNISCVKSKSNTRLCCYKLEQVATHEEAIKTMASACEWQLTFFKSKYNPETQKHTAPLYYIGPESNNEMSNEDILSFAE